MTTPIPTEMPQAQPTPDCPCVPPQMLGVLGYAMIAAQMKKDGKTDDEIIAWMKTQQPATPNP